MLSLLRTLRNYSRPRRGLPSRAQRGICFFLVVLVFSSASASAQTKRPKILGINEVQIASTNPEATTVFYGKLAELGKPCDWCEIPPGFSAVSFPSRQGLDFLPLGDKPPKDLLLSIRFAVEDLKTMKHWLKDHNLPFDEVYGPVSSVPHAFDTLSVRDPEGHQIDFIRALREPRARLSVIHAGFVVKDRAAMEHFYKDILGFHVYWQGGMRDGDADWVDLQVPDGTDWIEFMLNVPENADKQTLGIMNHIALGVSDVRAAAKELESKGMKLPEPPEIGRDGKWQLNLYDPDGTRIELMEFTPVQPPCCSPYTGPHPQP